MVKPFARSVLAAAALLAVGVVATACFSETESLFDPEPPKPEAGGPPVGSLVPDAGLDAQKEAGPTSCTAAIPETFSPTWKPPTKTAACSKEDITAYFDACLADAGKTEPEGTCTKWKADHADCGACAEPDDGSGPIQWHVNRKFYTLNVAGCIAVQQEKPEADSCGDKYNAAVQCSRASCESCFAIGGTFDQFRECQKAVQTEGICKSYETAQSEACKGTKDTSEPTLSCFNNAENQDTHFKRVIGLICGS